MAQSISSAQASFLAKGGLNDLGSSEEFVPAESISALVELAALIITEAQDNLNSGGQIATGALSDSIKANNPRELGSAVYVDIQAAFYYDFQNKGVRGTGGGASTGGYSFKTAFPGEKMVKEISDWLKLGKSSSANVTSVKHTVSKTEMKNKTISQYDKAYAVAHSIKVHGIKGTGYFDRAIRVAQQYAAEILGKALNVDIVNSIPKKLNTNGNSN